ncbi:hypothetical protein AAG570_000291 [Ranatra chinensis]|uniref:VPS13-like middle region domain-containing protein n=1 Tax=Ranatra chinensis TaxID=642074 RepID=A0ABD0YYS2_9HEMI
MQQMSEICIFSAPSIILTIEVGVGKTTVPMLLLQSSIQATVKDWSSQLSVDSHVCLEVAYYNNTLALWEPLIEPVETTKGGKTSLLPWELSLQVETSPPVDDSMSDVLMSSMVSDTSATTPKSLMTINITSKEILPISVTKTCLDVLKQLGASFTDAIYKPTEQMMQQMPQFILKNDTGLSITLLLNDSDFKVWLCELLCNKLKVLLY